MTPALWNRHPNECSEEDYKSFYRKVFRDYKEPLFWIHLNMDYPFNLKGILYFPKINMEYDSWREPSSCTTARFLLRITLRK